MTAQAPAEIAAVYRDDRRLDALIGPGGPFEVEAVVVDGIPLRDFVRAPRSILDVFDMGENHGNLVHVVYGDERLSFGQVRERASALARELRTTFDVRPGDRVAIAMRNQPEYVVAVWGAALCRAIVTPMNSWWVGAELAYALEDAGAKVAFLDADRADRVREHGRPPGTAIVGVRGASGDVNIDGLVQGPPIDWPIARQPHRTDLDPRRLLQ